MAGIPTNPGDEYIIKHKNDLYSEALHISGLMTRLSQLFVNKIKSNANVTDIRAHIKGIYDSTNTFLVKHNDSQNSDIGNSTIQSFKNIITALKDIRTNFGYNPKNNSSINVNAIKANFSNLSVALSNGLRDFAGFDPQSASPPSLPVSASATAGTPPLVRPPKTPTPLPGALPTVNENNETNENGNSNNNNENNTRSPITPSITEAEMTRNMGRLPISANPYFSYNSKIIKVLSRLGDTTTYKALSDMNTWGEEQTNNIPENELTPIPCPQTGGRRRRRTVRARDRRRGRDSGRGSARPTRRHRKHA